MNKKNIVSREFAHVDSESTDEWPILEQYMQDIKQFPLLKPDEVRALSSRKSEDYAAFERLVNCNLRLVVKCAQEFRSKHVSLMDKIQEGNIGLIRAVQKYDPDKAQFSTYAILWIKSKIIDLVACHYNWMTFRTQEGRGMNAIRRFMSDFQNEYNRMPTKAETLLRMQHLDRYYNIAMLYDFYIECGLNSYDIDKPTDFDPTITYKDILGYEQILPAIGNKKKIEGNHVVYQGIHEDDIDITKMYFSEELDVPTIAYEKRMNIATVRKSLNRGMEVMQKNIGVTL